MVVRPGGPHTRKAPSCPAGSRWVAAPRDGWYQVRPDGPRRDRGCESILEGPADVDEGRGLGNRGWGPRGHLEPQVPTLLVTRASYPPLRATVSCSKKTRGLDQRVLSPSSLGFYRCSWGSGGQPGEARRRDRVTAQHEGHPGRRIPAVCAGMNWSWCGSSPPGGLF